MVFPDCDGGGREWNSFDRAKVDIWQVISHFSKARSDPVGRIAESKLASVVPAPALDQVVVKQRTVVVFPGLDCESSPSFSEVNSDHGVVTGLAEMRKTIYPYQTARNVTTLVLVLLQTQRGIVPTPCHRAIYENQRAGFNSRSSMITSSSRAWLRQ